MIKLFIKNKITEICNGIYDLWTFKEFQPMGRYMVVYFITVIPMTFIFTYFQLDTDLALIAQLFLSVSMYMGIMFLLSVFHMFLLFMYDWIKKNIKLAKNGEIVKPKWKK